MFVNLTFFKERTKTEHTETKPQPLLVLRPLKFKSGWVGPCVRDYCVFCSVVFVHDMAFMRKC